MEDYRAKVEREVQSPFRCESCGAEGEVRIHAIGRSGKIHGRGFGRDDNAIATAWITAKADLEHDTKRVVSLVACQTCGHRNGRTGAVIRLVLWVLATSLWFVISGGESGNAVCGTLMLAGLAMWATYLDIDRFDRARAAAFLTSTRGTIRTPVKKPRPAKPPRTPELPIARAVVVPQPPAKVSLVVPPMPPAPNDGGPRLLR